MAPTDMAAAVRSNGWLAARVPVMRTKAIMMFFIVVALEMVYMGGPNKKNAGGFIAVVPVFVVVRIKAAGKIRVSEISIVIAVVPGFMQYFFSFA